MTEEIPPWLEVHNCRAANVLSVDHLTALGKVAAEWGMLEAALNRHGLMLLESRRKPSSGPLILFQMLTGNPGGKVTAERLKEIIPLVVRDRPDVVQGKMLEAMTPVSHLQDRRNEVLHGMWGVITESLGLCPGTTEDSAPLTMVKGFGKRREWSRLSAKEIEQIADDIAAARYQINAAFKLWAGPPG